MRALRRGQANRVEGSRRYASPILQWIRRGIIAALAGKQHGVVARWQLLDAGITARQIRLRLTSGRLHEIHRGVYLVGHTVRPPLATEQAALLACGKQATLSHRSAANLWDLLPYPASASAWVTVPLGRRVVRPRIHVRRAMLTKRDIRSRRGLVSRARREQSSVSPFYLMRRSWSTSSPRRSSEMIRPES